MCVRERECVCVCVCVCVWMLCAWTFVYCAWYTSVYSSIAGVSWCISVYRCTSGQSQGGSNTGTHAWVQAKKYLLSCILLSLSLSLSSILLSSILLLSIHLYSHSSSWVRFFCPLHLVSLPANQPFLFFSLSLSFPFSSRFPCA